MYAILPFANELYTCFKFLGWEILYKNIIFQNKHVTCKTTSC